MNAKKNELKADAYKWVKAWHLLFVTLWLGSAFCLIAGQIWLRVVPEIPPFWVLDTLNMIDWFILVPGATGVVITGMIFSLRSHWGWGKDYYWIRAKLVIAILGVIVGTFFLAPWLHDMIEVAKQQSVDAYENPTFITLSDWLFFWAGLQVVSLIYATYLSIFKPRVFQDKK
jgi:uncharacterized membrane protein